MIERSRQSRRPTAGDRGGNTRCRTAGAPTQGGEKTAQLQTAELPAPTMRNRLPGQANAQPGFAKRAPGAKARPKIRTCAGFLENGGPGGKKFFFRRKNRIPAPVLPKKLGNLTKKTVGDALRKSGRTQNASRFSRERSAVNLGAATTRRNWKPVGKIDKESGELNEAIHQLRGSIGRLNAKAASAPRGVREVDSTFPAPLRTLSDRQGASRE